MEEVARTLGIHRHTVRRWLKSGLEPIDGRRPLLIHGEVLIAFLDARKPKKQKLEPHEGFCLRCQKPRGPAFAAVEVTINDAGRLFYTALCEVCSTVMHKALGKDLLPALEAKCTVTIKHATARNR